MFSVEAGGYIVQTVRVQSLGLQPLLIAQLMLPFSYLKLKESLSLSQTVSRKKTAASHVHHRQQTASQQLLNGLLTRIGCFMW